MMEIDNNTQYFLSIAMYCKNYSETANIDYNRFAEVLGIVYAKHQEKIKNISQQGIALLITRLTKVQVKDYDKYIELLKDKVDQIIKQNTLVKDQIEKVNNIE